MCLVIKADCVSPAKCIAHSHCERGSHRRTYSISFFVFSEITHHLVDLPRVGVTNSALFQAHAQAQGAGSGFGGLCLLCRDWIWAGFSNIATWTIPSRPSKHWTGQRGNGAFAPARHRTTPWGTKGSRLINLNCWLVTGGDALTAMVWGI